MLEIYSYFANDSKELLIDHIKTALIFIPNSSRLINYASKLDKDFLKLARLAVIFHDFGKIFYQENWSKGYLSFFGHEFLSAYIFNLFRKQLIKKDNFNVEKYDMYEAVLFSILYHHHAMRRKINEVLRRIRENSFRKGYALLGSLVEILDYFRKKNHISDLELKCFENVVKKIKGSNLKLDLVSSIEDMKNGLWERFQKDKKFRKESLLLLMTLLTVDYLAARKNRETSESSFSRTIMDFHKIYLK